MRYFCCTERRREAIRSAGALNGIDYLEVVDRDAATEADRQRNLRVSFLKPPGADLQAITAADVHIEGGTRVTGIRVERASVGISGDDAGVLAVRVDRPGDYSVYTLRLGPIGGGTLAGLDPMLATVEFSFKVECPTDFDCRQDDACPPEGLDEPEINYLARDYASFRQLMLDRMSVVMPEWRERNTADMGIALIEALAYTADHLSYELDSVGMEASLMTARRRASIRRHARLVDYAMHDGANARAWLHVEVDVPELTLPAGTQVLSQVPGIGRIIAPHSDAKTRAFQAGPVVFETMHEATLHSDLNTLGFYTWGDRDCCLPAGATSATLLGHHTYLTEGDVLMFVELIGAETGEELNADPKHRHAVRLTRVARTQDPIGSWFQRPDEPVTAVDITEIAWADEDALPFPLCISATDAQGIYHEDVSIAHGNIVLVDHGRSVTQILPAVPQPDERLAYAGVGGGSMCDPAPPIQVSPRYAPLLEETPLTMSGTTGHGYPGEDGRRWQRFDPEASATSAMRWETRHVVPDLALWEVHDDGTTITVKDLPPWHPRRDLLPSRPFSREFAVEIDPDGRARLRFGDDEYGMRPGSGTTFQARYRIGSGPAGNVGADALYHVISDTGNIVSVTNPMPAQGGTAPESVEHVRRSAPSAFQIPQRAAIPQDYADRAEGHWQVQRAVATERWTGSWYTIFLTVDRRGGLPVDAAFESALRSHLERFRMAGDDLEIDGPRFVWLELGLRVCVLPEYARADVKRELLSVFGTGLRRDGQRGLFNPDRFTFGQSVFLSEIYAAAQQVPGVRFVEAFVFQRLGNPRSSALESGELTVGRLEIPRLDNEPSFPEHGVLSLVMEGGR